MRAGLLGSVIMNFDFSDDQKLLKEQVRKFLADKCPTKVVRRVLDGKRVTAIGQRAIDVARAEFDTRDDRLSSLPHLAP